MVKLDRHVVIFASALLAILPALCLIIIVLLSLVP
jgi:hypothetical protein